MENITLRKSTPKDSEFVYIVKKAAFREYVEQVHGWNGDEQRRFHTQRFETQDFRIIHQDSTYVGVMAVVTAKDCVKVNQLFLLPEYQGRGIGETCMRRIMGEARPLGLPVRLSVLKVNPRARTFYQKLGFADVGETEKHDLMEWTGG